MWPPSICIVPVRLLHDDEPPLCEVCHEDSDDSEGDSEVGGDLRDRFNLPAEKANPIRLRRLRTRLREVDSGADQRLNGEVMARARAAPSHCVRPDECGRLRAAARCGMELRILCRRQRVTVRPVLIASRGRRHSSCSIPVAPPEYARQGSCLRLAEVARENSRWLGRHSSKQGLA